MGLFENGKEPLNPNRFKDHVPDLVTVLTIVPLFLDKPMRSETHQSSDCSATSSRMVLRRFFFLFLLFFYLVLSCPLLTIIYVSSSFLLPTCVRLPTSTSSAGPVALWVWRCSLMSGLTLPSKLWRFNSSLVRLCVLFNLLSWWSPLFCMVNYGHQLIFMLLRRQFSCFPVAFHHNRLASDSAGSTTANQRFDFVVPLCIGRVIE